MLQVKHYIMTGVTWLCECWHVLIIFLMSLTGPKVEVLRQQQQPRLNSDTPPNRDSSVVYKETASALIPPTKSPFRLHNRFVLLFSKDQSNLDLMLFNILMEINPLSSLLRSNSSTSLAFGHSGETSQDPERSLTEYIHHLEKVQQRLVGARQGEQHLL